MSVHLGHTIKKVTVILVPYKVREWCYCHADHIPRNVAMILLQIYLHGPFSTSLVCHLQNAMLQLKTGQKPCLAPNVSCYLGLYDWQTEHHSNDRGWMEGQTGQMMSCWYFDPWQWLVLHHQFQIWQYCLWQLGEQMHKWGCQGQTSTYGQHGPMDWCQPVFQTVWQTEKPDGFCHDWKLNFPLPTPHLKLFFSVIP